MAKDPDEDPIVRGYPDPSDVLAELRDKLADVCNRLEALEAGGAGTVRVLNDGVDLGEDVSVLNFDGGDEIEAILTGPGAATLYHPAPTFLSHWNTADGNNGDQSVTESITRTTARISSPTSEGNPFRTGGWAGTNQDASLETQPIFTTPGNTTGFGGDSTVFIEVFDADGVTLIDSHTSSTITGNFSESSVSGHIDINITGFAADGSKFQANISVTVRVGGIFGGLSREDGRYHVRITHTTDSTTDGGQTFVYTQDDVFLDENATTPQINGSVSILEDVVLTKRLSGLHYYIIGSSFDISITDIDQLNRNTQRTTGGLNVDLSEYGMGTLDHSPFGTGSGNFSGWTNLYNQDNVGYDVAGPTITDANYRLMSVSADILATPKDPWASGPTAVSPASNVMIDTYLSNSTDTFEDFRDEDRREFIDGIGAAATAASFPGAGLWPSASDLGTLAFTPAAVFNDRLMVPSQTHLVRPDGPNSVNPNWSSFNPSGSFDYTSLGVPVNYARRYTQGTSDPIPNFIMTFSGTFAAGDALADLVAGNLEIYVYRIARPSGTVGAFGKPPTNTQPLRVHLEFGNPSPFDDGITVNGSGIRTGSSSGNTIQCSLGPGTPAETGIYCHIRITNTATSVGSLSVTFP